jgi:Response regulators consisting of a CheY-like receiver domain and a winged-helix DNA-binding domain
MTPIEKVEDLHMYLSSYERKLTSSHFNNITWDDKHHALKVAHTTVLFTAMEYRILSSLRHGHPVSYTDLARLIYNRELDRKARTMMDKHVERIRGKLRETGIYIYCVLSYGYILLPEILSDATIG